MKRHTTVVPVLVLVVVVALVFAACGSSPTATPQPTQGQPQPSPTSPPREVDIQYATLFPDFDLNSQMVLEFEDRVTERTNGSVTFTNFWSGSLLTATDSAQGLRDGRADMALLASSFMTGMVSDLGVFEFPYGVPIAPGDEDKYQPLQEELFPILDEEVLRPLNMKLLWNGGPIQNNIICRDRFLEKPEDFQGVKLRTAGAFQSQVGEAWGASTLFIPPQDLYTSLERGTADCALFAYTLYESFKLYEAAPYSTRTDYLSNWPMIAVNLDFWNSLSAEQQEVMLKAGEEVQLLEAEAGFKQTEEVTARLDAMGSRSHVPSDAMVDYMREQSRTLLLESFLPEAGPVAQKIADTMQKYWD